MIKTVLVKVTRYMCPFCLKIFKIRRHFCWRDPRNKSCSSCVRCIKEEGVWFCSYYLQSLNDVMKNHASEVDVRLASRHFRRYKIVNCSRHQTHYPIKLTLARHLTNKEDQ